MTFDIEKQENRSVDLPPVNAEDADVVEWNGPDDPNHPLNWATAKKWKNILAVATMTFLTPYASSMFAPAIDQVMREFHVSNNDIGSFAVSIYLLGYALGPLLIAGCSELFGRLRVYHTCAALFIITNLACGFSTNIAMLLVFRFLTGIAGAGPLTLGPGTVSDCFRQETRGKAMAVWTTPVLLGPCIGPAIGAYVAKYLGWRWNFWCLIIATGIVFIICLLIQDETYPPRLLELQAKRLRKSTGNASIRAPQTSTKSATQTFVLNIIRPTKMLCLSPIVLGLSLLTAVAYGTLYLLFTTVSQVFETRYGIVTNVGLVFFGFGIGQFAGLFAFALISDKTLTKMAAKNGGELKPEYRLPPMIPGATMIPVGLLIYGWTAQYRVFWFVPLIGTFLIGFGMISVFTPIGTYLVDAFSVYAASATAANTVLRSIGGGLLPLTGPRMYEALGQGWGNTLLAGVSILMMGMILLAIMFGERIRTNPRFKLNL